MKFSPYKLASAVKPESGIAYTFSASHCWLVLLALSALMGGNRAQAEWIEVDRSEIQTSYIDPAQMEVAGSRISLWLLSSYTTPRKYSGKKFQSLMSQYEYDCGGEQFRMLAYALRTGKTGKGEELDSGSNIEKWKRLVPGSAEEILWKKICTPDAGWSKVGESQLMVVYANPYTMRKNGNRAKLWELFDFKSAQARSGGKKYLSVQHRAEYDCKTKQYRTLEVEYHAENMGKGKEVFSDSDVKKWEAVVEGTADRVFWGMACAGEQ